jgi:hypothetical protein
MSLRDELKDPWSYVLAGLAGGLSWAVLPVAAVAAAPVALAVGAAVFGTKVVAGAFSRAAGPEPVRERTLPVAWHTDEAAWLARAEQAETTFRDIAQSAPEGPVSARVASFGTETEDSLVALRRLAGQASAVRAALSRLDLRKLHAERDRLLALRREEGDPALVAERSRALESVEAQLQGFSRLSAALTTLLARLETGAIGLEGLVARLAEVVALTETSGSDDEGLSQVDELAEELEGLRAGLVEAEGVSDRAMEGLPPLPGAVPGSVPEAVPGQVSPQVPEQRPQRATE